MGNHGAKKSNGDSGYHQPVHGHANQIVQDEVMAAFVFAYNQLVTEKKEIGSIARSYVGDINKIIRLSKSIEQMSGDDVTKAIFDLVNNNPALFLVELMADDDWMQSYACLSEHSDDEYKSMVLHTLEFVVATYKEIWILADYYCTYNGTAKEKFDFLHAVEQSVTDVTIEEIISARKLGLDFFFILMKMTTVSPIHTYIDLPI